MSLQFIEPMPMIQFFWNIPLIIVITLALSSLSDALDSGIAEDEKEIYHLRTRSAICIVTIPIIEVILAVAAGFWYTQHGFLYKTISICTLPVVGAYSLIGIPVGAYELRQAHKTKVASAEN